MADREFVEIVEVGPRDGLQNEPQPISTERKIAFIDLLSQAGFRRIEIASFVDPRRVPQMADGHEVLSGITRDPDVRYAALTPNVRGYEAARAAGADEVAIFVSASEGFSRANLNASTAESFRRYVPVAEAALTDRVPVRGYVSCVVDCPYDGPISPRSVAEVAARLADLGVHEISLGETLGRATPDRVRDMLEAALKVLPARNLAGHFHDTGGRALDNIAVALDAGIRVFDASVGGLGGCPFAPGAAGNVATEAVHERLNALGYDTGLSPETLSQAAAMAKQFREESDG